MSRTKRSPYRNTEELRVKNPRSKKKNKAELAKVLAKQDDDFLEDLKEIEDMEYDIGLRSDPDDEWIWEMHSNNDNFSDLGIQR